MSYATLMNVYENDPTYDQYIWSDILGKSIPGSLKTDLLDFLTLLHFARYEKPREFGFKLDPYKRIIGDTSTRSSLLTPLLLIPRSSSGILQRQPMNPTKSIFDVLFLRKLPYPFLSSRLRLNANPLSSLTRMPIQRANFMSPTRSA